MKQNQKRNPEAFFKLKLKLRFPIESGSRRCGLAFLPSGLKQHDGQCQFVNDANASATNLKMYDEERVGQCQFVDDANASAANLKTYDEERVKKMWYMFRSKKRGKMKRVGDGAGWQFNRNVFCLNFGLKYGLRFRFHSVSLTFCDFFLV